MPRSSVATLEKLALLKMAFCKAPVFRRISLRSRSVMTSNVPFRAFAPSLCSRSLRSPRPGAFSKWSVITDGRMSPLRYRCETRPEHHRLVNCRKPSSFSIASAHVPFSIGSNPQTRWIPQGNSSVNVAPQPVPSLWTCNAPPNSLAASAPLCRPKPCPVLRVVKP